MKLGPQIEKHEKKVAYLKKRHKSLIHDNSYLGLIIMGIAMTPLFSDFQLLFTFEGDHTHGHRLLISFRSLKMLCFTRGGVLCFSKAPSPIFGSMKPRVQSRFRSAVLKAVSLLFNRKSIDLSSAQEKEGHFHYKNFFRASK